MTTRTLSRWIVYLIAGSVLVVGLFLAVVVMEPRVCGMDEFECFDSRNVPRYLTGAVAVVVAIVIVITGVVRRDS
jgi:hypothetical protein